MYKFRGNDRVTKSILSRERYLRWDELISDRRDIKVQVVNQGTEKGRLLSPVDKGYTEPRGPISLRLPLLPRKERQGRSAKKREWNSLFRRPAPTTTRCGTSILFNRIILAAYRIQRELYSARSRPSVAREGKGRQFYCRRITRSSIRRLNGSISTPRRVRAFEFRCAFSLSIKQSCWNNPDREKVKSSDELNGQRDERKRMDFNRWWHASMILSLEIFFFFTPLIIHRFKIRFPFPVSKRRSNIFVGKKIKLELDCYCNEEISRWKIGRKKKKKNRVLELDPRISCRAKLIIAVRT